MSLFSFDVTDWNTGSYRDVKKPRKCARPWKLVHDKKPDVAVLCCHGYTGYPGEMARPGVDLFSAGFDVFCPRYSGHGTSREDFLATTGQDWLGTAECAAKELPRQYKDIYLIGHSMGGLIALILASRFPVKKMVLFAPALLLTGYDEKQLETAGRHALTRSKPWQSDPGFQGTCERDPDDDAYLGREYWSYDAFRQLLELGRLAKEARGLLPSIATDTLTICGEQDLAVSPEVAHLIETTGTGENSSLLIPAAGHLIQYEKNRDAQDLCNKAAVDWLLKG